MSVCTRRWSTGTTCGPRACAGIRPISSTCSVRPSAAARGTAASFRYEHPLLYEPPETLSLVAKVAYFGELDTLPGFQNVESPTDQLGEAEIGLVYRFPRSSVGSVDDETGILWSVLAHAYHAESDITPSVFGTFDVGWPLPFDHTSVWIRTGAGVASGEVEDPLANAYFGGFRNNYVDNGEAQRYRKLLSMPGFEIDALNGRSFVKGMLELNLPPIRFESPGQPRASMAAGSVRPSSPRRS